MNSLLDIPLTLEKTAQYLLPHHLLACSLVSKHWNNKFLPLLWFSINLNRHIDSNSILKHQNLIRSIASVEELFGSASANATLQNLRHIIKGSLYSDLGIDILGREDFRSEVPFRDSLPQTINLLSNTVFLETLFLSISPKANNDSINDFPDTLKRLPNLVSLDLSIYIPTKLEFIRNIIENSRRCNKFHLTVRLESHSTERIKDFKTSISSFSDIKFRDLRIQILDLEHDLEIVAPLLSQSPQVESFYLFLPYSLDTLKQISSILQDKSRRPLKFLSLEESYNLEQHSYWEAMNDLFQIVRNTSDNYFFTNESANIFKTPTLHFKQHPIITDHHFDDWLERFIGATHRRISHYVSNTITSLELLLTQIDIFSGLMSHLSQLQALRAKLSLNSRESGCREEIYNIPWKSRDLKILDLDLICTAPLLKSDKGQLDYLFKEIGRSQRLEQWNFECSVRLLTKVGGSYLSSERAKKDCIRQDYLITTGFLDHLQGLMQLYKLDLTRYYGRYCWISVEDIKMMLGNLPKLSLLILARQSIPPPMLQSVLDVIKLHNITLELVDAGYSVNFPDTAFL